MKKLLFLFVVSFGVTSCLPLSTPKKDRDRDEYRDDAQGEPDYELPDIIDLEDPNEIIRQAKDNCEEYDIPNPSIFGDLSITLPIRRCIAKAIDEGLKPICDQEREAKELLEYYEDQGDHRAVEELELYLHDLDEVKYDFVDQIYLMADDTHDLVEELEDKIDDESEDDLLETLKNTGLRLFVRSELSSITQILDHKANLACRGQIDFDKVRSRNSRR